MVDDTLPEPDRADGTPHPRLASRLIGQDTSEEQVLQAVTGARLHHAWLITGAQGIGKATLAWRMARYLLSTPLAEDTGLFGDAAPPPANLDVDPDHPVARRIAALSEPRLFLLRRAWDPDRKRLKTQITVDEVRALKSFFNMSAAEGGRRVAIIDSADEMNVSAANALLKILEEPPKDAALILISHQPSRLLPTIRSRCRLVRLSKLSPDALTDVVSTTGIEVENSEALAALADGSAGDAVRLLNNDGIALYTALISLLSEAPMMSRPRVLKLAETMSARGAEEKRDLFFRLFELALTRLAQTGAGRLPALAAAPNEHAVLTKLSPNPGAARAWAALHQETTARAQHALAVNIDLQNLILDLFARVDATASAIAAASPA